VQSICTVGDSVSLSVRLLVTIGWRGRGIMPLAIDFLVLWSHLLVVVDLIGNLIGLQLSYVEPANNR